MWYNISRVSMGFPVSMGSRFPWGLTPLTISVGRSQVPCRGIRPPCRRFSLLCRTNDLSIHWRRCGITSQNTPQTIQLLQDAKPFIGRKRKAKRLVLFRQRCLANNRSIHSSSVKYHCIHNILRVLMGPSGGSNVQVPLPSAQRVRPKRYNLLNSNAVIRSISPIPQSEQSNNPSIRTIVTLKGSSTTDGVSVI